MFLVSPLPYLLRIFFFVSRGGQCTKLSFLGFRSSLKDEILGFFFSRLEDPDVDEVQEFVDKQVCLTESLLQTCEMIENLKNQITTHFDHPRYDTPFKQVGKYFYFHNTGVQAQNDQYMQVFSFFFLVCFENLPCYKKYMGYFYGFNGLLHIKIE